jgi:hypothetical protein
MTNQTFPITPPPELAQTIWRELRNAHYQGSSEPDPWDRAVAKAYRAGADAELEACCEWFAQEGYTNTATRIRAARRPKPPESPTDEEEVEELVADLRTMATHAGLACQPGDFKILTRAANMIQRLGKQEAGR